MGRPKLAPPIAAIIALLIPSDSEAAGLITGLTASPNPAQVSQDVTFTVKGTGGGCGDLTIDFGDGQSTNLAPVSFTNNTNTTAAHKYAAANTYAAKATPGKSCAGTATASIAVGGGGAGGTGGAGGGMVSTARPGLRNLIRQVPIIEEVFGPSQIRPGGAVIVLGRYFGGLRGEFRLKLSSGLVSNLGQLTWKRDAVSGVIDANITGVPDQPARLQLVDADGNEGNEWPVTFTASREMRKLSMSEMQCFAEEKADVNECNFEQSFGPSFNARHKCTDVFRGLTGCYDAGVDRFTTTLAEGWKVDSVTIHHFDGRVEDPPTIVQGGPGPVKLSIWWDTGPGASIYAGSVFVVGPAGTPHN